MLRFALLASVIGSMGDSSSIVAPDQPAGSGPGHAAERRHGGSHAATGVFIENRGQWDVAAEFVARLPGMIVRADRYALWLQFFEDGVRPERGVLLRLEFTSASDATRIEGLERVETKYSYFLGNDPDWWHRDVPAWRGLVWRGITPGVDLELRSTAEGVEYELRGASGLDELGVRVEGAAHTWEPDGELLVQLAGKRVAQPLRRRADEIRNGNGWPITGPCAPGAPQLTWSTYLGSSIDGPSNGDYLWGLVVGPDGDVYATGEASGPDFPVTPGTYVQSSGIGADVFVTRLRAADSALVYSTVLGGKLGGGSQERGYEVVVDPTGRATVVGYASSTDFPTTRGAYDRTLDGQFDAFALRLSASGSDLEFSSLLGGWLTDEAHAVALTAEGAAVVGGFTASDDFPITPGAFKSSFPPDLEQGFVTRFSLDGSALDWSTYLGGSIAEFVRDLSVDAEGSVTVLGQAGSPDYPVTAGAWAPPVPPSPYWQVFVSRLNSTGSGLIWSTVFGASYTDHPLAMSVDALGAVVVAGYTQGDNFPTTPDSLQPQAWGPGAYHEGFVVRLEPNGSAPIYSTYFGDDNAGGVIRSVACDASGAVTLAAHVGISYPLTPGAYDTTWTTGTDMCIARLDPAGQRVLYATALGGQGTDAAHDLAIGSTRRVAVGGYTNGDYPITTNASSPTYNGGQTDAMVTSFDLELQGVCSFGGSSTSCIGEPWAGTTKMPSAGASDFAFFCSGAPPLAQAWLLVGQPAERPRKIAGAEVWIELSKPFRLHPAASDRDGWVETGFSLQYAAPGATIAAQFVLLNPTGCGPSASLSASQGLSIAIQ